MLFRDGDGVVVRWFADKADAAHPYLRFVGDGQASMPVDEVAQGLTDFVVRVLDRIEGMGAPEVEALRRDWAAITTAPPDEREFCIWSARVGLDPYDPDELTEQRENMLKSSVSSLEGELRGDLLDATTVDALPTDARWIDAAHDIALESGLSAANEPALAPVGHRSTAHETGYECARTLRGHLGANGGPVADMRAVMRALGWAREPLLTTDSRPTSPLDAILDRSASGAPVVVTYQDGGVESERFRLARSLFLRHFTAAPGPSTGNGCPHLGSARSFSLLRARAFRRSEFLAPAGLADGRMKVGISPPLCRGRRSSTPAVGQQRGQSRNRSAGRQAIEPGKRFGWFGRIVDEQLLFDGRYQPGDALTVRGDIDRRSGPHHPEVRSEPRLQLGGTYLDHDHNLGQYMDNIQGQASGRPSSRIRPSYRQRMVTIP